MPSMRYRRLHMIPSGDLTPDWYRKLASCPGCYRECRLDTDTAEARSTYDTRCHPKRTVGMINGQTSMANRCSATVRHERYASSTVFQYN